MGMTIELRESFDSGFNLTEKELRNIYSIALSQIKDIVEQDTVKSVFILRFKNASFTTEESSLEYIFSEDNSSQKAIHSLTIALTTHDNSAITINFDADVPSDSISYTVSSDDRHWAYLTSSRLEAAIAKVMTFSPSSRRFRRVLTLGISLVITIFVGLISAWLLSSWNKQPVLISQLSVLLALLTLLSIGISVGNALFPSYNFYWGDYIETIDKRRAISRFITYSTLLVIGTGIVASIIASYLVIR
jgi:hypothetical protein